jgi:hypothetical protein
VAKRGHPGATTLGALDRPYQPHPAIPAPPRRLAASDGLHPAALATGGRADGQFKRF